MIGSEPRWFLLFCFVLSTAAATSADAQINGGYLVSAKGCVRVGMADNPLATSKGPARYIENACRNRSVWIAHCHMSGQGSASARCRGGKGKYYTSEAIFAPGRRQFNQYTLPSSGAIRYAACFVEDGEIQVLDSSGGVDCGKRMRQRKQAEEARVREKTRASAAAKANRERKVHEATAQAAAERKQAAARRKQAAARRKTRPSSHSKTRSSSKSRSGSKYGTKSSALNRGSKTRNTGKSGKGSNTGSGVAGGVAGVGAVGAGVVAAGGGDDGTSASHAAYCESANWQGLALVNHAIYGLGTVVGMARMVGTAKRGWSWRDTSTSDAFLGRQPWYGTISLSFGYGAALGSYESQRWGSPNLSDDSESGVTQIKPGIVSGRLPTSFAMPMSHVVFRAMLFRVTLGAGIDYSAQPGAEYNAKRYSNSKTKPLATNLTGSFWYFGGGIQPFSGGLFQPYVDARFVHTDAIDVDNDISWLPVESTVEDGHVTDAPTDLMLVVGNTFDFQGLFAGKLDSGTVLSWYLDAAVVVYAGGLIPDGTVFLSMGFKYDYDIKNNLRRQW
ncbi:MAG: hypothetical protein ACI9MC_002787 [Kiritimatiellia bacterium]|jgi:hypothetical protein